MPCFAPLKGYWSRELGPNGKRKVVFNVSDGFADRPVSVPCGQCVGCRLERSRQWAVRCVHEAACHDDNCFITLTYNDSHLPSDEGLHVDHFQRFMKRLRKKYGKVRFFHCGEYGDKGGRPHYHACLFGFDFPDRKLWQVRDGVRLYTSEMLEKLWSDEKGEPIGFCTVGDVTFQSAAYVARYIVKKVTGKNAEVELGPFGLKFYQRVDLETGEVLDLRPEYVTMSRRPGIGKTWLEKFKTDVYPRDYMVMNGAKMRPPRYYDNQFEIDCPTIMQQLKADRVRSSIKYVDNNTPERLNVREAVQLAKLNFLKRNVE